MLVSGDEISRTQGGNNNAYCQDNEISWLNWEDADQGLLAFTSKLINLRNSHAVFSRKDWFKGQPVQDNGVADIEWFLPDGSSMNEEHWGEYYAKSVALFLNGKGIHSVDSEGKKVVDDSFYIIFNAHHESVEYTLPEERFGQKWQMVLNTATEPGDGKSPNYKTGDKIDVDSRSVILLQDKDR